MACQTRGGNMQYLQYIFTTIIEQENNRAGEQAACQMKGNNILEVSIYGVMSHLLIFEMCNGIMYKLHRYNQTAIRR